MAFNAKNLNYEMKEPSFLRKLKSNYGGAESLRHERPLARPRKLQDGEGDDGPTYVDEDSNDTISKTEYEILIGQVAQKDTIDVNQESVNDLELTQADRSGDLHPADKQLSRNKQTVADVGNRKKRKAGKLVGEDKERDAPLTQPEPATQPEKKKKTKKVKLSFDAEAEEA
ncbi:MAG: hypothetical protein M1827_001471 [Pycnora praestabilis]|nr:MAG: hypothetical protein M1827_001471 [Pycnora praestabilis]